MHESGVLGSRVAVDEQGHGSSAGRDDCLLYDLPQDAGDGVNLRYGSVCSGIEAATVAWHPLGFEAQWFAEIAAFPSAVLAARWPTIPNLGDFTKADDVPVIDLLVGGTPCQDFSVAGLRAGLDGDRGNLALEFFRLACRTRSRWVLWENVPGVLSSNGGRDFGAILGALAELGYGFAYRILDAQYFGVPQRRRRVFVVGYLGDWRRAAAVLFERDCLSGNPAPSREEGASVAGALGTRSPGGGWRVGADEAAANQVVDVSHAVTTRGGRRHDPNGETYVAHALRGGGFDASEDGTGRGTPLVTAFAENSRAELRLEGGDGSRFPDAYTLIEYNGKPAADGPRYEAIGNSMAVPVMRWIGERIAAVESLS